MGTRRRLEDPPTMLLGVPDRLPNVLVGVLLRHAAASSLVAIVPRGW